MAEGQERDIDLVLVTGAGASRDFGNARSTEGGGPTLPLMGEWSNALIRKLASSTRQGVAMVGLSPDLDGPEFERRLGRFLALVQLFPDLYSILEPSARASNAQGVTGTGLQEWHQQTTHQLNECLKAIYESLSENFGFLRTDPMAATEAYGKLLRLLRITAPQRIVYATTNYDRLGGIALDRLGWRADAGERQPYIGPATNAERLVDVADLTDGVGRLAPVLHLHGAMDWYRRSGQPHVYVAQEKFDENWGAPVILLPDPDKDYEAEPVIQAVWKEFRKALRRAKMVFVLGHSLHDTALVTALRTEVVPMQRIGIGLFGSAEDPNSFDPSASPTLEIAERDLPQAHLLPIRFGRDMALPEGSVKPWLDRIADMALA